MSRDLQRLFHLYKYPGVALSVVDKVKGQGHRRGNWADVACLSVKCLLMPGSASCVYVGLLGSDDISAFSICFQVEGLAWAVSIDNCSCCDTHTRTQRERERERERVAIETVTLCEFK